MIKKTLDDLLDDSDAMEAIDYLRSRYTATQVEEAWRNMVHNEKQASKDWVAAVIRRAGPFADPPTKGPQ